MVVLFKLWLEPFEYGDGLRDRRLCDVDFMKTTRQCGVFFSCRGDVTTSQMA